MANLETRRGVQGFLAKFLFEKAHYFWDTLDLQAFEEVLALLIYGMVLFPNPDQLIDVNAVNIFCLIIQFLHYLETSYTLCILAL